MKKTLILGGTLFVGRNLTEQLLSKTNQYDVTLFHRGKSNPDLFPEIKKIQGDRKTDDIKKIANQNWDVIIDMCGYYPNNIDTMLDALKGRVGRYVFVSTSSHLQIDEENTTEPINEDLPLVECSKEQRDDPDVNKTYNEKKAECERVIESKHWLDSIIIRPALIVGQYDYSDRLYYWFYKMHTQQKILIPNLGKELSAFSDVRDLATILVKSIEVNNNYRIYNAGSYNTSIRAFLDCIKANSKNETEYICGPPDFLKANKVEPWFGLPLWVENNAFQLDNSRIEKNFEMTFRTVEDTTQHLLDYYGNVLKWSKPLKHGGISDAKEKELIELIGKQSNEKTM